LSGKNAALIGYGDVGKRIAKRMISMGIKVNIYDPAYQTIEDEGHIELLKWPNKIGVADFVVIACALTDRNYHLLNSTVFEMLKPGVKIINVSRGPIIDEKALISNLKSGKIHSVALDVFEEEPLPTESYLLSHPLCILGSHNASNTDEAVRKASEVAIQKLFEFLNIK